MTVEGARESKENWDPSSVTSMESDVIKAWSLCDTRSRWQGAYELPGNRQGRWLPLNPARRQWQGQIPSELAKSKALVSLSQDYVETSSEILTARCGGDRLVQDPVIPLKQFGEQCFFFFFELGLAVRSSGPLN